MASYCHIAQGLALGPAAPVSGRSSVPSSALAFVPLTSSAEPERGVARLRFLSDPAGPRGSYITNFYFIAAPWVKTGLQPFAWDYIPPRGEYQTRSSVCLLAAVFASFKPLSSRAKRGLSN